MNKKALKYFNEAMIVNPSNYLVYYNLGNTYAEMKNFSKALHYYSRTLDFNEEEQVLVKEMFLLTTKPILYIANVSEEQLENADNDENVKKVKILKL